MKKIIGIILVIIISMSFIGCDIVDKYIDYSKKGKVICTIDNEDGTQFIYNGTKYIVLNEIIDNENIGEWVGYIQKYIVMDSNYKVLKEKDITSKVIKDLKEIAEGVENEAKYIVPYNNVYTIKGNQNYNELIVIANGKLHKAIPSGNVKDNSLIIKFETIDNEGSNANDNFTINPNNCTQILSGEKTYQITNKTIDSGKLGEYLGIIPKSITFDNNTKKEIVKSELMKVELEPKELSKQQRITWNYGTIYNIKENNNATAVEINNKYYLAEIS